MAQESSHLRIHTAVDNLHKGWQGQGWKALAEGAWGIRRQAKTWSAAAARVCFCLAAQPQWGSLAGGWLEACSPDRLECGCRA